MDPDRPEARSVAIEGGRILAVGTPVEVDEALGGRSVERIDVGDGAVLPGLHDSHVHLTQHGFERGGGWVQLGDAESVDEAAARVAAHAATLEPGRWIFGTGFALARWGLTTLDSAALDRAAPHNPVLIRSQDHHSAWVNRRAFEATGVDRTTPDPEHGEIVRDAHGEPSGLLLERALHTVWDRAPLPSRDEIRSALAFAGDDFARRGVTAVHHMAYEPAAYWRELALQASDPAYPVRVWACIPHEDLEHAEAIGLATGQGGEGFQIGGAKFFVDGALGSGTAWMLEPYATGGRGVQVDGPDTLAARIPLAIRAGLTPVAHAIGDAATRAVLDAFEAHADALRAAGLRPRLEHAQHLHDDDVARVARVGAIASMQPLHMTFDAPAIRDRLGDRTRRAYRIRDLDEAGARLAFGSDTPVAPMDVAGMLRAATDRRDAAGIPFEPDQAVSLATALEATTSGAAAAIGWSHRSGRLVPGYDADLVWFGSDPRRPGALDDLAVRGTVKAGRWTFRA